jgi:hypothetical protein
MGVLLIKIFYVEDYVKVFDGAQAWKRFGVPPSGGARTLPPEGGTPNFECRKFFLAKIHLSVERNCSLK